MLTSQQIEAMRALIVRSGPNLYLMRSDQMQDRKVVGASREQWSEIFDLAAMAARIRER